jgi:hypothetical protein
LPDELFEHLSDPRLARVRTERIDVRAVGEEKSNPVVAELREACLVRGFTVGGRGIEAKVAGVNHEPGRRADRERRRVGDRVRHPNRLDLERADPVRNPRRSGDEIELLRVELLLRQSMFRDGERVRRPPDR